MSTKEQVTVAHDTAEAYWWVGALAVIKLSAKETGGGLTVLEVTVPEGYVAPPHVHRAEDETFSVLEGDVTFTIGDRETSASAGDVLFGPRDVPHHFRVHSGPARILYVLTPGGFEGLVRETGEPAATRTLPPPEVVPDFERVGRIAARYGNEILA
jgi:quercetin dioxygenase-like cupin family protein